MKIAIVNNYVPFIYGGAEFLADSLKDKLIEYGHEVLLVKLPFNWEPPSTILEHMLSARLIRLEGIDRVIALKFPAYYVNHPNKILWLLHQFRQVYDLWNTPYQGIPATLEGKRIKEIIIQTDNRYLNAVKKIYTNSGIVSGRLKKYNDIDSEVLYPPLMDADRFHCMEYGDYFFYPSRISHGKRQHLVVESMKYTKSDVRLIIAGNPDTKEDFEYLQAIIKKGNLQNRVTVLNKYISQEYKAELFANALGCTYTPYYEDSYGYVTLEAYHSRKPVITCSDSGGTDVVVKNGITGSVVPPEPEAIAEAMDELYYDKKLAKKMGTEGLNNINAMEITWDKVIKALIE